MDSISSIYKDIRRMFQSAVPPYVATINDDYHYEVWAIKQQAGQSQSSEELHKLGEEARKRLFSALLLTKMNGHGRISIHRMTHQLHADLQEAIANLMRYYSEMNWI